MTTTSERFFSRYSTALPAHIKLLILAKVCFPILQPAICAMAHASNMTSEREVTATYCVMVKTASS